MTSATAFAAQSTPGGLVSFAVTNPGDTLTIGSPLVESAAMFDGSAVPPVTPTLTNATTAVGGGTFAATGNYSYVITAVGPNGESIPSNERTVNVSATTRHVNLTWTSLGAGYTYNVYRTGVAGSYSSPALLNATPLAAGTTTYTDFGAAANPGAPPMSLAAGLVKIGPGTLTLTQNDTYHGTTYV